MSPKTRISRAWCNTCRAFTNHRKAEGENPPGQAKLECVTCSEDVRLP
jgi:hypothetical protein